MKWYLKVMRDNYANFSGRARREEYWMFTLFYFILFIGLFVVISILGALLGDDIGINLGVIILIIFIFAHFIPSLAVTIRRLHDTGKSGWYLLLQLIPYIGALIIFIFTVIEGDKNENKWGPNPKL
tara:strand:+ start:668 stop:1045 length:378 start_codon:yes stop_codon:yes gene_type:complete